MERLVQVIIAMLLLPLIGHAQWNVGSRSFVPPPVVSAPIALAGHCAAAFATVGFAGDCTITGLDPAQRYLITAEYSDQNNVVTNVYDTTNGNYTAVFTNASAPSAIYYFADAQPASDGTLLLHAPVSSGGSWMNLSAQAWNGAATTNALDAAFSPYFATGTTANPSCSASAVTPAQNGELVLGYNIDLASTTVTAGASFTLIDSLVGTGGAFSAYPEYWVQGTATATNVGYTHVADSWLVGCAAFKHN